MKIPFSPLVTLVLFGSVFGQGMDVLIAVTPEGKGDEIAVFDLDKLQAGETGARESTLVRVENQGYNRVHDFELDVDAQQLYYVAGTAGEEESEIRRINADGTGSVIVARNVNYQVAGLALNTKDKILYFTHPSLHQIWQTNLNTGAGDETLLVDETVGLQWPTGLTYDEEGDRLFVSCIPDSLSGDPILAVVDLSEAGTVVTILQNQILDQYVGIKPYLQGNYLVYATASEVLAHPITEPYIFTSEAVWGPSNDEKITWHQPYDTSDSGREISLFWVQGSYADDPATLYSVDSTGRNAGPAENTTIIPSGHPEIRNPLGATFIPKGSFQGRVSDVPLWLILTGASAGGLLVVGAIYGVYRLGNASGRKSSVSSNKRASHISGMSADTVPSPNISLPSSISEGFADQRVVREKSSTGGKGSKRRKPSGTSGSKGSKGSKGSRRGSRRSTGTLNPDVSLTNSGKTNMEDASVQNRRLEELTNAGY